MKYISKHHEPQDFTAWKAANPTATYKKLGEEAAAVKQVLKNEILEEQGYICCYCERTIDSAHSHLEHFRPKDASWFPELQLEYTNLHASCNKYPTKTSPNICGVKKENAFSADLISPLESDCSTHFKYNLDGTIHEATAEDHRASYTISLLGLDDSFLNGQRAAALLPFLDQSLTLEELTIMKGNYLQRKADGCFNPFYTMIEYLLGSL